MGGGDEKPPFEGSTQSASTSGAGQSAETALPLAVVLEVRPEFSLIAPCGPPSGRGATRDEVMVMARIKASRESDEERRAPVNICAVIDRSESMRQNIPLVKQSLEFMVQQLRDEDKLSLLAFDHEASTLLPMTAMDLAGRERAAVAFGKLKERGQTNLSGGLLAGLQQFLMMKPTPGERTPIESVLLFTDGKANRGITNMKTVAQATRSVIQQIGRQVSVFTFGFSEEHEADALQSIADAGNGLYYYVADIESIPDSFCDCLGGLLSVSAQNIVLELKGCNDHTISKPLAGFTVTACDGNEYKVEIPDIYSEESKDILFNVTLSVKGQYSLDDPAPLRTEIAQCRLTYFDVQSCKVCTTEQMACVEILPPAFTASDLDADQESRLNAPDTDVALQRIRQATSEALTDADRHASANDAATANVCLDRCVQIIESSPLSAEPFAQHQKMTLLTAKAGVSDSRSYRKYGAKHVRGLAHANMQQRSNTNPVLTNPVLTKPVSSRPEAMLAASRSSVPPPPPPPPGGATAAPPRYASSASAAAEGYDDDDDDDGYNPYRFKAKKAMMKKYRDKK